MHVCVYIFFISWLSSFSLVNWCTSFTKWKLLSFSFKEDDKDLNLDHNFACMASQRIGEIGLSESGPSSQHVPYGVLHGITTSTSPLMYSFFNYFSILVLLTLIIFLLYIKHNIFFLHFFIKLL